MLSANYFLWLNFKELTSTSLAKPKYAHTFCSVIFSLETKNHEPMGGGEGGVTNENRGEGGLDPENVHKYIFPKILAKNNCI